MNPDLSTLRNNVDTSAQGVAKFQQDIPGILSGLKTNLTSIFTNDNPMMAERNNAMQTYLNTPSSTRASLLPDNQPMVAGSPLNFSPTQQNAMVEARRNAALVPLAGLNQSIVGQYGNLADILSAAAQTYQSQLDAAKTKASSDLGLYKSAIDEYNAITARDKADKTSGGMGDLSSLIATLLGNSSQPNLPPLSSFNKPETSPTGYGPLQISANPTEVPLGFTGSQPIAGIPQSSLWDNLMGMFGATPRQSSSNTSQSTLAGNLNFGSLPLGGGY